MEISVAKLRNWDRLAEQLVHNIHAPGRRCAACALSKQIGTELLIGVVAEE